MSVAALVLTALLAPLAVVAVTNALTAPRLHRARRTPRSAGPSRDDVPAPRVSVLVPARNEAHNIPGVLEALQANGYPGMEIVVLDDRSTDGTAGLVYGASTTDPRVRLLRGSEAPAGWVGKNWACHQLAEAATGTVLLFCDADVRPGPDAVARTVATLRAADADALTALPRHLPRGWFEQAVIPLVATLPVLALLPLALVRRTRAPALAYGNGQWFAWSRTAYETVGGHAGVRSDVLEDVRLARRAKAAGLRLAPVVAPRDLAVRMYRGPQDTWEGFVKNLYPLVGGRPWSLAVAVALLLGLGLGPIALAFVGPAPLAWLPLAGLIGIRTVAALTVRDGPFSVVLHPVGVVAVAALAVASWRRHAAGTVAWKERTVTHRETA